MMHNPTTDRTAQATQANSAALSSRRRGAPHLTKDSDRQALIMWCLWCDHNGIYTDEDSAAEGWAPLTVDQAWDAIALLLEDS